MRDLTEDEQAALTALAEAWNAFLLLPQLHPDDLADFRRAIHSAQNIVMSRPALQKGGDPFTYRSQEICAGSLNIKDDEHIEEYNNTQPQKQNHHHADIIIHDIDDSRILYSVKELSKLFTISERSVYNLIETGTLKSVRLGGRRLVRRDEVEKLIGHLQTT